MGERIFLVVEPSVLDSMRGLISLIMVSEISLLTLALGRGLLPYI